MITEQEKIVGERQDLLSQIQIMETRIKNSEPYERLKGNADFEKVLSDMKDIMKNHDVAIAGALHELANSTDPNIRIKWTNYLVEHTIEREQIEQGILAQDHIINAAKEAREKLPELRDKLEAIKLIKTDEERTHE